MSKKKKTPVKKIVKKSPLSKTKKPRWKKLFFFFSGTAVILLTLSLGLLHKQVSVLGAATSSLNALTVRNVTSQMLSVTETLDQRIALAKQRKDLMNSLLSNPQAFLQTAMPAQERSRLPAILQQYIEQPVALKGTFTVIHHDNFSKGTETDVPVFKDMSGNIFNVFPTKPSLPDGHTVIVKGIQLDTNLVFDNTVASSVNDQGIKILPTLGNIKVAVVLITIPDVLKNHVFLPTNQQIQKAFFDSGDSSTDYSVNAYMKETSYNKMQLQGDVLGWFPIKGQDICNILNFDSNSPSTYNDSLLKQFDIQVGQQLGNPHWADSYQKIVYVTNLCFGSWSIGIPAKIVYINGELPTSNSSTTFFSKKSPWVRAVAHELGHSFGFEHAEDYGCHDDTGKLVVLPVNQKNCGSFEYEDLFDVMGGESGGVSQITTQYNIFHKLEAGWIDSTNIQTITQSGIYTLYPLEQNSSKYPIIALKIPRGNDPHNPTPTQFAYYIELRQPLGKFDPIWAYSTAKDPRIFQGVTIRMAPVFSQEPFWTHLSSVLLTDQHLLDTSGQSELNKLEVLLPNNPVIDPATKMVITLLNVNPPSGSFPGSATVQVYISPNDPTINALACSQRYTKGVCQKFSCGKGYSSVAGKCSQGPDFECCIPQGPTPTKAPPSSAGHGRTGPIAQ